MKGQVLSDCQELGGHGRLSGKGIDQLQEYYGRAIRRTLMS
jgi:hypothetical protein